MFVILTIGIIEHGVGGDVLDYVVLLANLLLLFE